MSKRAYHRSTGTEAPTIPNSTFKLPYDDNSVEYLRVAKYTNHLRSHKEELSYEEFMKEWKRAVKDYKAAKTSRKEEEDKQVPDTEPRSKSRSPKRSPSSANLTQKRARQRSMDPADSSGESEYEQDPVNESDSSSSGEEGDEQRRKSSSTADISPHEKMALDEESDDEEFFDGIENQNAQNARNSTAGKKGKRGTGKGAKGTGAKGKVKGGKSQSRSSRAGLQFPVGRIARFLRKSAKDAGRISPSAPVYLAAVLEYLAAEMLELSGNAARDNKRTRIKERHLQLAVRNDEELNKLLGGVTIAGGGVLPNIHNVLLSKKRPKKDEESTKTGTSTHSSKSPESLPRSPEY